MTLNAERRSDGLPDADGVRKTGRSERRRRVPTVTWIAAIPAILLLLGFHIAPTIAGGYFAFTDWNGLSAPTFVGWDNFVEIFRQPVTRGAMVNTIELAAVFFVLVMALGLSLALGLNRLLKTRGLIRSLVFVPVIMSPLAVGFVWRYIFDQNGALNQFLGAIGLKSWQHPWLGDPTWAIWTILVVLVWQYTGLVMVVFLAGLQSIDNEVIEAAAIDGAGSWGRFRHVVFPLLAPSFTIAATLALVYGLRVFDQVIAMTNGGPAGATETLATQAWQQTFVNGRFGYGSAFALVLTVIIAILALSQLVLLRRREKRL